MILTKICGISSLNDLEIAVKSGTDAIGFLIGQKHNAIGFISPELAKEFRDVTPPFINTVVVTHLENIDEIRAIANIVQPTTIQLHSDLNPVDVLKIKHQLPHIKFICKVSVTGNECIDRAKELESCSDALLLDSIDLKNDRVGGTGLVHDWSISREIVSIVSIPVILAGGLNHNNVIEAINIVQPNAVDVNSGVSIDGRKDKDLVNKFVLNAKRLHL